MSSTVRLASEDPNLQLELKLERLSILQVPVPRYVFHVHSRVQVRPNASSARLKVKPSFVELPEKVSNSSSLRSHLRPSPAETTHTLSLSLQPHKNSARTMSDSTHIPLSPAEAFRPRATLRYASAVGIQAAGVGAIVSTIQNALGSHNYGAAGVLTRTGGTIGFFGMSSFLFLFTPPLPFRIYPWTECWVLGTLELGCEQALWVLRSL